MTGTLVPNGFLILKNIAPNWVVAFSLSLTEKSFSAFSVTGTKLPSLSIWNNSKSSILICCNNFLNSINEC